jgi:hypothetical protein
MTDKERLIAALPPQIFTTALCEALLALPPDAQLKVLKDLKELVDTNPKFTNNFQ